MSISDNLKIDFYMFLWETYNSIDTIEDFESKVYKYFERSENDFEDTPRKKRDYIPVLKDFFSAHNIELTALEDNLFVAKKILNMSKNIYVDLLKKKILNMSKIFFEVEGKDDVKMVSEETVKIFLDMYAESELEKKEIIEIIKNAIRGILKLSPKDAIFLVNNKILIRYFSEDSGGEAKRYGGIPANEMDKLYKERTEDYYRQVCKGVVKDLAEGDLNFRKINNITFHKNYIKAVQKTLSEHLSRDFMQNPSLLPSFTNYVFRIFFDEILMGFADAIISLVFEKNANVKNFISFYDGKDLYLDQAVIKKPTITLDEDTWTYSSIAAVAADRERAREIYDKERVEYDRVEFLINKMKESKEALEKQKAELDSLPNTPLDSQEYKNIVLDIEIGGKEIARRGEILKDLAVKVAPYKQEFELFEAKLFEIKKAIVATIGNFRI